MRHLLLGSLLALVGLAVACGDDLAVNDDGGSDDDAAAPAYEGPAKAGVAVAPDASPDFELDPVYGDGAATPLPCCNITFSLPDGTRDEAVAQLRGDVAPVDGSGIGLAWANGAWSATACVPVQSYLRYRFYFGQTPEIPGSSVLVDVNRTNASSPQVDDGAGGFFNTFGPVAACSDVDASVGP